MTLCTDDVQTAGSSRLLIQLDIGTTTCHVGGDGYRTVYAGLGHDSGLLLMELGIEDAVLDAPLLQHGRKHFRGLDGDGTHQHRCAGIVDLLDLIHNRLELLLLGLVYRVVQIDSLYRTVGGNADNIHEIDVPELLLLGLSGTGHAGLLVKLVEEILEGDGGQGSGLTLHVHMLLRLDGLVETVGITAARHDTAGKLIDDEHLIILHHIVLVSVHQVVGPECQDNVVLDLQILGIRQVFNMEEFLHLLDTILGQVDGLLLFIHDEVAGLLDFLAENGVDLRELCGFLTLHQLSGQHIADLIELGGLAGLTGNDQRRSGLIDQDGVHLIDDTEVQTSEHLLLLINGHVVAEIVEAQLVVGHIGDVAAVGSLSLLGGHLVQDNADLQSQELMHLTHPLRISLCQIVVDSNDMNALSLQRIQISRTGGNQGLTFTGTHLCDTSLMQHDAADELYRIMLHAQYALRSLPHRGEGLRQKVIQCLAVGQPLLELRGLCLQLLIRHRRHLIMEGKDLVHLRPDHLQLSVRMRSKNLFKNIHQSAYSFIMNLRISYTFGYNS